jgi:hypothetical protein
LIAPDSTHTPLRLIDRQAHGRSGQTAGTLTATNYVTVTGAQIGTYEDWVILARSPFYILLNVAVGGNYPGDLNANTQDGLGSGMDVKYVGVYAGIVAA